MSNIRRIGNIVLGIVLAAVVAGFFMATLLLTDADLTRYIAGQMKKEEQKSDDRK